MCDKFESFTLWYMGQWEVKFWRSEKSYQHESF